MFKFKNILLIISVGTIAMAEKPVSPDSAIAWTIGTNFELRSFRKSLEATELLIEQADRLPNPEAEMALENLGVNEVELLFTQPFELGGKRRARVHRAEIESQKAKLEIAEKSLALKVEVLRRYLPIAALRSKISILDSIITMVNNATETIRMRVEAGAVNKIDAMRAEIKLEELQIEKQMVLQELQRYGEKLAVLWGDTAGTSYTFQGTLFEHPEVAPLSVFLDTAREHPEIQLLNKEVETALAEVRVAKSESNPDLEISGGYLRNNEREENALLLSANIDLPLFNRNREAIRSGESEAEALSLKKNAIYLERKVTISDLYSNYESIENKIERLRSSIIPKTRTVLDTVLHYYSLGSIGFLDVIEAYRENLDLKTALNDLEFERAIVLTELYANTGYRVNLIEFTE